MWWRTDRGGRARRPFEPTGDLKAERLVRRRPGLAVAGSEDAAVLSATRTKTSRIFSHFGTILRFWGRKDISRSRDLVAGEKWETGILEELHRADIVLLFYTSQAKVSRFIQEKELPISLERSDAGKCSIIWVPLERNDLKNDHPLEKRLRALLCGTVDARTIYSFEPHSLGWLQVEDAIRKAVEKRRAMSTKRG